MKPRALVVDDEIQMVSIVTFALETQDFICDSATCATAAWELLQQQHYDLVVLDILMPHGSGIELTAKMRAHGVATPVILLTALGEESDRIAGLEAGADDYVTKPFSPRELALRAQAIVRRVAVVPTHAHEIVVGDLRIDERAVRAWFAENLVTESQAEVAILALLAKKVNDVVPTRDLVASVWGPYAAGGREMVKTTVYRLRKHLEQAGGSADCIRSQRGVGYSLNL